VHARSPLSALMLTATLAAAAPLALAQTGIYKSRDAQGNVIYSDKESEKAETVQLPPTNTMDEVAPAPREAPPADARATAPYATLAIVSPADGANLFSGGGLLDVSIDLDPPLRPEHSLRVLLDGAPAGFAPRGTITLEGLSRGPHTLQAQVLDERGDVILSSGTVSVQIQRPVPNRPPIGGPRPVPH
jgi:Domain of unknown function (DUF4124)